MEFLCAYSTCQWWHFCLLVLSESEVAQPFPQAEWGQLLDARMHPGFWSLLLEPAVLQSVVYISATPVLCARSSSPFCGCLLRGSYSTCRWWQFCLLVLPESKFVALCLLPTLAHVFQLQKFGHLAPQGDLPTTPIPVLISASSASHFMDSCRWLCVSWPSV